MEDASIHEHEHDEPMSRWARHQFILLIVGTIIISLVLVAIALAIYRASGAAQLDLSRPGYRSVSGQTLNNDNGFSDYSPDGPINQQSVEQFRNLYDKQAQTITALDAFGGDPLNPNTVEFGQTTTAQ